MIAPKSSFVFLFGVALLGAGCTDVVYLGENGFYSFAITEDTPSVAETNQSELFIVEHRVDFPIREPTAAQLATLEQRGAELELAFPRAPWVERDHYRVSIDYLLINLDDAPHRVTVAANAINEFHEYSPGVVVDNNEIFAEYPGWERLVELEPLARYSGSILSEDVDEMAADLAAVVQPGVTNPNTFMHPDSRSDSDPRAIPFLPPVIPGLVGVKMALRTEEAANIVCEFTIRIRDDEDRIVDEDRAWQMPPPEVFEPSSITGGVLP